MSRPDDDLLQLELELAKARRLRAELEDEPNPYAMRRDMEEGALTGAELGAAGAAGAIGYGLANRRYRTPPVHTGGRSGKVGALLRAARSGLEEVGESAASRPLTTTALETGAGAAAGAAGAATMELTKGEEPWVREASRLATELAAGTAAGPIPSAAVNGIRRAGRWFATDLAQILNALPLSGAIMRNVPVLNRWPAASNEQTAERIAAESLQSRVPDRIAAASAARTAPDGITPARATGDEALMGVEARLMEENPELRVQIENDLEEAVRRAQTDMLDLYETPRGRQDWEQAVVERVAPEGAKIPAGSPKDMLDAAYSEFDKAYAPAKGFVVRPRMESGSRNTPLATIFRNIPNTRTSMAGDEERRSVGRWLDGKISALRRREKDGLNTSEDLLALRSEIRGRVRAAQRAGHDGRAELLQMAGERITDVLRSQLPKDAMDALRAADQRYAAFSKVDSAFNRSKTGELTPDNLLAELRYSARGRGRNPDAEMRSLAQSGRRATELLGDPDKARAVAGELDDVARENMRSDFVHTLVDRATRRAEDGTKGVDGAQLQALLSEETEVGRALGLSHEELGRLDRLAGKIKMAQRSSSPTSGPLLVSGPTDVADLVARIAGAKVASEITSATGSGAGGLTIAGWMSKHYGNLLKNLSADRATELLVEASRNPELYAALLTKSTAPPREQFRASQMLNAWLGIPTATASDLSLESLREISSQFEQE